MALCCKCPKFCCHLFIRKKKKHAQCFTCILHMSRAMTKWILGHTCSVKDWSAPTIAPGHLRAFTLCLRYSIEAKDTSHRNWKLWSGPEVIKKNSCSAQWSMKFFLPINIKMQFNIYWQEKFHAQLYFAGRKFKLLAVIFL